MSETVPPAEECPICSTGEISRWEKLDTWICEECSYVFDGDGTAENVAPLESLSESDADGQVESEDWRGSITPHDRSEANLIDVLSKTEAVAEELGLSEETELRVAELVTQSWKSNFMLGRTKTDTVGAAVYAATREASQSIPPALIADAIGTEKRRVKDFYTSLKSELDIDVSVATPEEFVPAIADELGTCDTIERSALELLDQSEPTGGNPVGVAAAALYQASSINGEDLTQREVAAVVDVTKETIWRHCNRGAWNS